MEVSSNCVLLNFSLSFVFAQVNFHPLHPNLSPLSTQGETPIFPSEGLLCFRNGYIWEVTIFFARKKLRLQRYWTELLTTSEVLGFSTGIPPQIPL